MYNASVNFSISLNLSFEANTTVTKEYFRGEIESVLFFWLSNKQLLLFCHQILLSIVNVI